MERACRRAERNALPVHSGKCFTEAKLMLIVAAMDGLPAAFGQDRFDTSGIIQSATDRTINGRQSHCPAPGDFTPGINRLQSLWAWLFRCAFFECLSFDDFR